jgi:hypothetical protein
MPPAQGQIGEKSVRIAIAIGEDVNLDLLKRFTVFATVAFSLSDCLGS